MMAGTWVHTLIMLNVFLLDRISEFSYSTVMCDMKYRRVCSYQMNALPCRKLIDSDEQLSLGHAVPSSPV